ncbi:hypothetical protein AB9P05_22950 [Roseivirga sp. BDSF3-8]|uniref:hypothetical protein n=1 Tax=Roseivirga sp. BDSF3-8 TaxID=3241598 RepID=UPI0035319B17
MSEIPEVEPRIPVKLTKLRPGEGQRIREVWPVPVQKTESRLKRGDLCYLGVVNDKAVSYHWVQTSGSHFVQPAGKDMVLNQGQFMIYHTRVDEKVKGKRINPFVICTLLKELKEAGYHQGLIYTASTNQANQRSLERVGFRKILQVKSLRIGKRFYSNWKASI